MIRAAMGQPDSAQLTHRLDAVLLVAAGRSCREVANWFGVDRRSVQRWVHNAYVEGLQGLVDCQRSGRPKSLSTQDLAELHSALALSPVQTGLDNARWSGKRLACHLQNRYGLTLSVRTCQRWIAQACADRH